MSLRKCLLARKFRGGKYCPSDNKRDSRFPVKKYVEPPTASQLAELRKLGCKWTPPNFKAAENTLIQMRNSKKVKTMNDELISILTGLKAKGIKITKVIGSDGKIEAYKIFVPNGEVSMPLPSPPKTLDFRHDDNYQTSCIRGR